MCASTVQVAALPGEVVSNTGKQNRKVLAAPVMESFASITGVTTLLRQKMCIRDRFKTLRTNLQFCGQDICTVVITSCNENEGKTTITLQLAKSLAELDKRVLVIDADKMCIRDRYAGGGLYC